VRRWARKRQGIDPQVTQLRPGRVYILPTGVGLVFATMAFAMLLGSMNYNNNLSFLLTFMLIGIGFVAMHQCQRNLVNLELSFAGTEPVFAGQAAMFRIAVTNRSKSARQRIRLYTDEALSDIQDLSPGESRIFVLPISTSARGWITLDRFGIRTLFPFELFRSWAWLHMEPRGLVYPSPVEHAPEPPASRTALGHRQHDARGEEDFAGLRKFHLGDSPRNVAWKAFRCRYQQPVVRFRQGSGTRHRGTTVDPDALDRRGGPDPGGLRSAIARSIVPARARRRAQATVPRGIGPVRPGAGRWLSLAVPMDHCCRACRGR
jgi:uncharacterized protein (DUF58 family)